MYLGIQNRGEIFRMKSTEEWFKQSDYDLTVAESLFKSGHYIYTIFMYHLSVEKALKGLYAARFQADAPKTHDLSYLSKKIEIIYPEYFQDIIDYLDNVSIPTRYPDELKDMLKMFPHDQTDKA